MARISKVEPTKVDVIPPPADTKLKVDASEKPKKRSRKDDEDITMGKGDAVSAKEAAALKSEVKAAAPLVVDVATQTAKHDAICSVCVARRAREAGYARKARARKRAAKVVAVSAK